MARIVLSKGGTFMTEFVLSKERVTIGRRSQSDIRIDDLAVSGEHAVIVTLDNDSCLEDLNSTNGTQVNGQPVRKHFLRDQDVIELAQYRLRYLAADTSVEVLMACANRPATADPARQARVRVVRGANAGRETVLVQALTTFGKPGFQVAAIARRGDAYYLSFIGSELNPTLNGEIIASGEHKIADGDLIAFSDTQLQFVRG